MRTEYRKRIVDEILAFDLECMGAVLIEGPKWCGKTRTGIGCVTCFGRLPETSRRGRRGSCQTTEQGGCKPHGASIVSDGADGHGLGLQARRRRDRLPARGIEAVTCR